VVASTSASSLPPGPVTTALLGKTGPIIVNPQTATPAVSPSTPTSSDKTTQSPPSAPSQAPGNQVPGDFFTSSSSDLSEIANNFQPSSVDSDFPQQYTPPPSPQQQQFNAVHAWGSAAMMLALVGSALTKHPITSALNAGAQVMSAFKQNVDASNTQAYNEWKDNLTNSYNIWKTNAANAIQNHRYEMTYLSKIMSDNSKNDKDKETEIMAYARATKNYGLMQILATQGLGGAEDYMNKYANLGATLSGASDSLDALYQWNAPEPTPTAGGLSPTPSAPPGADQNITSPSGPALEGTIPIPGGGYVPAPPTTSPESSKAMQAYIRNPFMEQIPAYVLNGFDRRYAPEMQFGKDSPDVNLWNNGVHAFMAAYGIDPIMMSSRRSLVGGINSSISKLTAQQQQAMASDQTFDKQWQYVQQNLFSSGAPPTDLGPSINEYIQSGKVTSGDPNTVAYATAIGTMAEEYAKVISGSTGSAGSTVNAQEYARQLFNPSYNKSQMTAAIQAAQANMRARTQSYSDTINQMNNFITAIPQNYDEKGQQVPTYSDEGGSSEDQDQTQTPSPLPSPSAPPSTPTVPSGDGAIPVPPAYAKLKNGTSIYKGSKQYVIYNGMAVPVGVQ